MLPEGVARSVRILEDACRLWFRAHRKSVPWFPGLHAENSIPSGGGPLDVVLMGDALIQLNQLEKWPQREFRIWTLGTRMQRVCTDLFGLSKEEVGVIPRYELFPVTNKPTPFPQKNKPWTLIYGGRIAPRKNLNFLYRLVSCLQTDFNQDVQLLLAGPRDTKEYSWGNFQVLQEKLTNELPWTKPPQYLGDFSEKQWLLGAYENPVAISLSTYLMEDFGVSLAQAQQAGWPCIISDWGGHGDIRGKNILSIPSEFLFLANSHDVYKRGLVYTVAEIIDRFQANSKSAARQKADKKSTGKVLNPRPVQRSELDRLSSIFLKKYGLALPYEENFFSEKYAKSSHAKRLLADYRKGLKDNPPLKQNSTVLATVNYAKTWVSHGEIGPAIEAAWFLGDPSEHQVIPMSPLYREDVNHILALKTARRIVIPSLEPKIIDSMRYIRENLGVRCPFIIYTHGEFTSGASSIRALHDLLTSRDLFISASRAEAETVRLCYINAKVTVLPFPLGNVINRPQPAPFLGEISLDSKDLVYMGRISEQKNLHTILLALWHVREVAPKEVPRLHIFGSDDNYGSPNMGMPGTGYEQFLKGLSKRLGLDDRIIWHGIKSKGYLEAEVLSKPFTFISASLHSDEDFGVSAFRSLERGNKAILSLWGGHIDLARNFRNQTQAVRVEGSDLGPFVSPISLSEEILKCLRKTPARPSGMTPLLDKYKYVSYRRHINKVMRAVQNTGPVKPLRFSRLAKKIMVAEQRQKTVFSGYGDPNAQPFFQAYGMGQSKRIQTLKGTYLVAPWVDCFQDEVVVSDPHRGIHRYPNRKTKKSNFAVMDCADRRLEISREAACWLVKSGYAFFIKGSGK